ncbi:MAG: hypothetical protein V4720_06400 [Pseudomonadota bacterium]
MTPASALEPRPGTDLPDMATVTADQPTVVLFGRTLCPAYYRGGYLSLAVTGIRHGRLGLGLGGGGS